MGKQLLSFYWCSRVKGCFISIFVFTIFVYELLFVNAIFLILIQNVQIIGKVMKGMESDNLVETIVTVVKYLL